MLMTAKTTQKRRDKHEKLLTIVVSRVLIVIVRPNKDMQVVGETRNVHLDKWYTFKGVSNCLKGIQDKPKDSDQSLPSVRQ